MTTVQLWYYLENGKQSEPVTRGDIIDRARSGALSPDDLVWTQGMEDWAPLRTAMPDAVRSVPQPPPLGGNAPAVEDPKVEGTAGSARAKGGSVLENVPATLAALMIGGMIVELIWGMRVHDFSDRPYLVWTLITAALILAAYWLRERRLKREMPGASGFGARHGKWLAKVAAGALAAGVLFTATCWSQINEDIYLRAQGYGGSSGTAGAAPAHLTAQSAALKADLRNLAVAEEVFWTDSSHYTTSLDLLHFTASPGVTIRITGADTVKWGAVATPRNDATKGCAMWGSTKESSDVVTPKGAHPAASGEVLCDDGV